MGVGLLFRGTEIAISGVLYFEKSYGKQKLQLNNSGACYLMNKQYISIC